MLQQNLVRSILPAHAGCTIVQQHLVGGAGQLYDIVATRRVLITRLRQIRPMRCDCIADKLHHILTGSLSCKLLSYILHQSRWVGLTWTPLTPTPWEVRRHFGRGQAVLSQQNWLVLTSIKKSKPSLHLVGL